MELGELAPEGSQAILEGFSHIAHVFYFTTMSTFLQGCRLVSPLLKQWGYKALFL
jgi:hypothetical protein